jgi:hypothetical protein
VLFRSGSRVRGCLSLNAYACGEMGAEIEPAGCHCHASVMDNSECCASPQSAQA